MDNLPISIDDVTNELLQRFAEKGGDLSSLDNGELFSLGTVLLLREINEKVDTLGVSSL